MSRRGRSKREGEAGAEVEAGAGVDRVVAAENADLPPTAVREKVGARGEGSKVGHYRV